MDKKTEDLLIYMFYAFMTGGLIFMVIENLHNPWPILTLSVVFYLSFTIRYIFGNNMILILLEVGIIFSIGIFDVGTSFIVYYFILIANIVIIYKISLSLLFTLICYTFYSLNTYLNLDNPKGQILIPQIFFNMIGFIAVYAFTYALKYVISQNNHLKNTTENLKLKTLEQNETYNKLLKSNRDLEEMIILKERNKIARDIHDTIGHCLTTALIEIEAGKTLINKNKELSFEKFMLAQGQVKKCLDDVRHSVRTLKGEDENTDFMEILIEMIINTERHTDITIRYEIDNFHNLPLDISKTIYRTVQEGLTNGIKHGKSTVFVISIKKNNDNIDTIIQDNGIGCRCIIKGFGLSAMEDRVTEVGGKLIIESEKDEGFTLRLSIPVLNLGGNHEKNKSINC